MICHLVKYETVRSDVRCAISDVQNDFEILRFHGVTSYSTVVLLTPGRLLITYGDMFLLSINLTYKSHSKI